jgi:hypothetical protein
VLLLLTRLLRHSRRDCQQLRLPISRMQGSSSSSSGGGSGSSRRGSKWVAS